MAPPFMNASLPSQSKDTCYYDALCGFCRRSVRILRALDWLRRLNFADLNTASDLPVDLSIALQGIPMRTRTGRILVGFPAMRRALLQTPLAFFPALLLYVPGISHLGAVAYRTIAVNRPRDACRVPSAAAEAPQIELPPPPLHTGGE